jgi:hypothetical protein
MVKNHSGHPQQSGAAGGLFKPYAGDIFGEHGEYVDGMIYLSRMQPAGSKPGAASIFKEMFAGEAMEAQAASGNQNDGAVNFQDEMHLTQTCATGLFNYSCMDDSEQKLVGEKAVPALAKMALLGDEGINRSCAACLVNLATHPDVREQMLEEEVLKMLSVLSRSRAEETRLHSAMAFNHLSAEDTFDDRLVQDGAMGAITTLINAENEEIKRICSMTLVNVAGLNEERPVNEDVLPALGVLSRSQEQSRRLFAAEAIRNLSCLSSNHSRIMEGGAVTVIRVLCESDDDEIKVLCAQTLCNLSCFKAGRDKMIKEGAVLALIILAAMDVVEVKKQCAFATSNLCCNPDTAPIVITQGAVKTLVGLASLTDADSQARVASALANLSVVESLRVSAVKDGASGALIALSKKANTPEMRRDIVVGICNLSTTEETGCTMVMNENVVPVLIKYVDCDEDNICLNVGKTICNLAKYNSVTDAIMKLVPALIDLSKSDINELKCISAESLNNLSSHDTSRQQMIDAGVVPAMIALAEISPGKNGECVVNNKDTTTEFHVAACLCNLTYQENRQQKIVDDEAVSALIAMSKADSNDTRLCCAAGLCNLSNLDLAQHPGLFPSLLSLSTSENVEIMNRCAAAFYKLSCHKKACESLASDKKIAPGLISMMRSGHGDTQLFGAKALCNVSTITDSGDVMLKPASKKNAVTDFVVIALLRVNNDEIKEICSKAFFNLMTVESTRQKMLDERVLWALIKLSKIDSEEYQETKRICANTLFNLSCNEETQSTLMEIGAVHVIADLAKFDDVGSRKHCAGALMKLSFRKGDEGNMVEEGAIAAAQDLSLMDDAESKWNCATVMFNLSCHTGTREKMVKDQAVHALVNLSKCEDVGTSKLCVASLCNLSESKVGHALMVADGGVSALIQYLHLSMETKTGEAMATWKQIAMLSATALFNLSCTADTRPKVVEAGGVPVLLKMAADPDADASVAEMCCRILTSISWHQPLLSQIIDEEITRGLTSMCKQEGTQCDAAVALFNVSFCSSHLVKMIEDGVLDAVHELVTNTMRPAEKDAIYLRCAGILRNLSCTSASSTKVVERDNLMDDINLIAEHDNEFSRQDISVCLSNLAGSHGAEVPALKGCLATMIALSNSGNEETRQICGVAVFKLSEENSSKLEDGSVSALLSLLEKDDDDKSPPSLGPSKILPALSEQQIAQSPTMISDEDFLAQQEKNMKPTWAMYQLHNKATTPMLDMSQTKRIVSVSANPSFWDGTIGAFSQMNQAAEKVAITESAVPEDARENSEVSSRASRYQDEVLSATDPGVRQFQPETADPAIADPAAGRVKANASTKTRTPPTNPKNNRATAVGRR